MAIWFLAALLIVAGLVFFDLAGFYWPVALIVWIEVGHFSAIIGIGACVVL